MSDIISELPKFVLNRTHTLFSVMGPIVHFIKNVPTHVPHVVIREAVAIGAERLDGNQGDGLEEDERPKGEPVGEERESLILTALEDIHDRNEPKEFNAAGIPKATAVAKAIGFTPDGKELGRLWMMFQARKSSENS